MNKKMLYTYINIYRYLRIFIRVNQYQQKLL